jgi:hypothetical protein
MAGSHDCRSISVSIIRRGVFPATNTRISQPSNTRMGTHHQDQQNCRPISALIIRRGARHVVTNRLSQILSSTTSGYSNG